MSKRSFVPTSYGQCKKPRGTVSESTLTNVDSVTSLDVGKPTDTESALVYLKNTFPSERFLEKLPPVILVHQVYSLIKNRTKVDQDINNLQAKGVIRLFKLGGEEDARVVIYYEDLLSHVKKCCPEKTIIKRFLKDVLSQIHDVGIRKEFLQKDYHITEHQISDLVNVGLLTIQSESSYWFSFPNAGEFMRTYMKGRQCILRTIKKSKFSEILQFELEKRILEKSAKLGIMYHIHDIIGAELVTCVDTTSGTLLRCEKPKK